MQNNIDSADSNVNTFYLSNEFHAHETLYLYYISLSCNSYLYCNLLYTVKYTAYMCMGFVDSDKCCHLYRIDFSCFVRWCFDKITQNLRLSCQHAVDYDQSQSTLQLSSDILCSYTLNTVLEHYLVYYSLFIAHIKSHSFACRSARVFVL